MPTRPWRPSPKRVNDKKRRGSSTSKKCDEASVAEAMFDDTMKDTLEKSEGHERRMKTATMLVESLATTDAGFFKTLLNRQEEAQNHLDALSAQLSTVVPAANMHTKPPEAAHHLRPHHVREVWTS